MINIDGLERGLTSRVQQLGAAIADPDADVDAIEPVLEANKQKLADVRERAEAIRDVNDREAKGELSRESVEWQDAYQFFLAGRQFIRDTRDAFRAICPRETAAGEGDAQTVAPEGVAAQGDVNGE